ncbi:MAG TPA: hypothetical protein VLS89_17670 [Candidatus Nanopelagicales bacterium]|nr:hypothetical protein [Candidatus Nanopelagicales bacterium]
MERLTAEQRAELDEDLREIQAGAELVPHCEVPMALEGLAGEE